MKNKMGFFLLVTLLTFSYQSFGASFTKIKNLESVTSGLDYIMAQPEVSDPIEFKGKKVAILAAHGVQDIELIFPYEYLKKRGASVEILAPSWSDKKIISVQYLRPTLEITADNDFGHSINQDYDMIIITGGAWNSTVVRTDKDALTLIQKHHKQGKIIAAICSGPQVLINAGLISGHRVTGTSSIEKDLLNAGGKYLNEAVVVEDRLITGRGPSDSIPFVNALGDALRR